MKQQFVVTHRYTVLQETEKTWPILSRSSLKHVVFLRKYKEKHFFCGYTILTEGVFVTHLSSNAEISVWRIVWLTKNCRFMSDIFYGSGDV